MLQNSLQQLRELQLRNDMILDLKLRCSNEYLSVIEYYVRYPTLSTPFCVSLHFSMQGYNIISMSLSLFIEDIGIHSL